jgi:hypothetical protein
MHKAVTIIKKSTEVGAFFAFINSIDRDSKDRCTQYKLQHDTKVICLGKGSSNFQVNP